MIKQKVMLKVFSCALLLFCGGCGPSAKQEPTSQKVISINLGSEPASLDPRLARDSNSLIVLRMLFDGLTRIGPDNRPQLSLASRVELSSDLKTYTFHLRPSKWSNGDTLTAHDFEYAWKKLLSPTFHSDVAFQLYILKNAKEVKAGTLPSSELGVKVLNPLTLIVELENPTPYFLEMIASPIFFPVNQNVDTACPKWADKVETYVCNGPFMLKKWKHHDLFSTVKNPQYWDADVVQLDGIDMIMVQEDTELKLFEKKQLNWMGSPLSTIPVDALHFLKSDNRLHTSPIAGTQFIRLNTSVAPLNNPSIRKAFALAINRQAIVDHVTQAGQIPATGLVPPVLSKQKEPFFHDGARDEARELFQQGLNELGITLESFPKLTLTCAAVARSHLIAQALQQQWNETFGVQLSLESLELKVYFSNLSHQAYQLILGSWLADFSDPVNFLELFQHKTHGSNHTNWENPEYSKLLEESFKERNLEKRHEILVRSEKALIDSMPIIPIYHYTMSYMKDDRLHGAFISSLGNIDFKWAYLENPE